jgi:N-acetylneuraminic acid mutarotase
MASDRLIALYACAAALLVLAACADAARAPTGWRALRDAGLARTEVAVARVGDYAYVAGGYESRTRQTTAAVERYDLRRNRWRRVADMPLALNHPAAAAWRGRLYVVGGYTGAGGGLAGESAALLRYDPARDRWSRLPPMPTPRAALAVGVIGNRLYAAGGAAGGRALTTLEVFDLRRRRWRSGPPLRVAREHLAGAVSGRAFYVLAGRAAGRGNFAVAERYVPATRRWERLPAMRKPRGGIAAAAVGGDVVVLGGEEAAGTIAAVERYQPARRRWTMLPAMRTPRHGLGAVAWRGNVYAIEGGPKPGLFFSDVVERLRVRAGR